MNIKVVIVWAVAIVLFAGIGVFGYVNQGILENDTDSGVYIPNTSNDAVSKTCSKNLAKGTSAYRFLFDKEEHIEKVIMTYTATAQDIEAYSAANTINSSQVNGVSVAFSGGSSDFLLIVTVDLNTYDRAGLETIRASLNTLSMVVDSIKEYETYKTALNANDATNIYICD